MAHPYMLDIYRVGKRKPLGYLPLKTIVGVCGEYVPSVMRHVEERELSWLLLSEEQCSIRSGALYVYDRRALARLLSRPENQSTLHRCGWPSKPSAFVNWVARYCAYDPELYKLVALTFNDPRYRLWRRLVTSIFGDSNERTRRSAA